MTKKNDVVIVSKEEAYWIKVKEDTEQQISNVENQLKFLRAVLEMSNTNIENEKDNTD